MLVYIYRNAINIISGIYTYSHAHLLISLPVSELFEDRQPMNYVLPARQLVLNCPS